MTIEAFRASFLPHLRSDLTSRVERLTATAGDPLIVSWLRHAVELSQGGKCLRPYLANAFYAACHGSAKEDFLRTSVFLEIFHLFALVHDDIIDRGVMRHGLPTSQRFILATMERDTRTGDLAHVADGQAILIGDLLLFWTADIVHRADMAGMDRGAVWSAYREMLETVMIGEMIDVDICTRTTTDMAHVERKSLLKSGHYSMLHPLVLGAAFAGSQEGTALAREAGTPLGLAFQIQDDYLDIVGDAKHVGKVLMNDIAEGQHTFFTQYVADHGTQQQRETLTRFRGTRVEGDDIATVREAFQASGALEAGERAIREGYDAGKALLTEADFLDPEAREGITDFIDRLKNRTK